MKKIGSIKGVPVIEGDTNQIKQNQIHYKQDQDGAIVLSKRDSSNTIKSISGGKSDGGTPFLYYKVDRREESFLMLAEVFLTMPIIGISNKEMGSCGDIYMSSGSSSTTFTSAYEVYKGYCMSDLTTPAILKISTAPHSICLNNVTYKIDSGDAFKKLNDVLLKVLDIPTEIIEDYNQIIKVALVPSTEDEYFNNIK